MPRLEPRASHVSNVFWEATRSQQLLFQRCDDCDEAVWYPRERCVSCLSANLRWHTSEGRGSVYTFNVMRKPGNPMMTDEVPYVIALVDLDEGYRMATNIVGCTPEEVACDMPVTVSWEIELSDGRHLPVFRPGA